VSSVDVASVVDLKQGDDMPKLMCPKCDSKMKTVSRGNIDEATWRKGKKLKVPSKYQVFMRCTKGTCRHGIAFSGKSKEHVHSGINAKWRARRHEVVGEAVLQREYHEALVEKRTQQEKEK